jgi:hypothetical protein
MTGRQHGWRINRPIAGADEMTPLWVCLCRPKRSWRECEMAATSVRDAEISTETGEHPLDLLGTNELELARLLTGKETGEEHQALDLIAWKLLEGAQNVRRWLWTVILVALALLVVGFFAPSP